MRRTACDWMWRRRNGWAMRVGIACLAMAVLAGQAEVPAAPADSPAAAAPAAPGELQAPLLDASHGFFAFGLAERWVRQGSVDAGIDAEQLAADLYGVRVTLRQDGFTVGLGDALREDASEAVDGRGGPVGVADLTRRAVEAALADLRGHLEDARLQAVRDSIPGREIAVVTPADIAGRLQADVQLARRPVTVRIPRDADPNAVLGSFAPGFHGLRLVGNRGAGSLTWPGTAIALNLSPRSQLIQPLSDEGHPQTDLAAVGRAGGPVLQRFEAIQVVRAAPGQPPVELVRGSTLLPPIPVTMRTLDDLADRLGRHLADRFTQDGRVRGAYLPTRGEHDPPIASEEDTAWACYALAAHARAMRDRQPSGPGQEFGRRALDAATALAQRQLNAEAAGFDAGAASLTLLALVEDGLADPRTNEGVSLRDALGQRLRSIFDDTGVARRPGAEKQGETRPAMNAATQALATAALAALFDQTRDPATGEVVGRSLDALWTASRGNLSAGVLPWYASAVSRVGALLAGEDAAAQARLLERRRALASLVDTLAQQQVIEPPRLGPADVVGGFELVKGPPGSPPNPNWYTAHLLHFVALAIADDGIAAQGDRMGWILTSGLAARFVGQLMMDEPASYYVRNRQEALRGVRLALYDNTLPVYATAISLLAVTQQRAALEKVLPDAVRRMDDLPPPGASRREPGDEAGERGGNTNDRAQPAR